MKPEQLKQIAEWLRYEAIIKDGYVLYKAGIGTYAWDDYDPENNAEQRWEILDKFSFASFLKMSAEPTVLFSGVYQGKKYTSEGGSKVETLLNAALQASNDA